MRRYLIAVLFSCAFVAGAFAQSQNFVISANAAGYGGAKGTQAVAEAGAGFQLTSDVSVAYARISNPTDSTQPVYNLGVGNYTRELKALLGSKLSAKLAFDSSNWLVTFQAGVGRVSSPVGTHIAEIGGVFLSRPVANNLQLTCGYQLLHGQGTTIITRNNSGVPTVGMTFTF